MLKARLAKEIVLRLQNDVGALDRIARAVSDKGVNLVATACWVEGPDAILRLVTEDNLRASDTLRAEGYSPREADVVVAELPHKPGMLHWVTRRLAQGGIDLHHLYVTGATAQDRCFLVFASANNDRALVLLNA
jgi:hypothetical protein